VTPPWWEDDDLSSLELVSTPTAPSFSKPPGMPGAIKDQAFWFAKALAARLHFLRPLFH